MPENIGILFLAAEAEPYVKIGGLADVAGSLPLALRNLPTGLSQGSALDARLVLPLHRAIRPEMVTIRPVAGFSIFRRGVNLPVRVFQANIGGMPVYFIDGEPISKAASVYSQDLAQDREKFAFFSLAALEMVSHMDWKPHIVHANDWHTSLAVYALRSGRVDPKLRSMHSLLTLHNLPYMGGDGSDVLEAYGMNSPDDEALPVWARSQPLPLGIWAAEAVVAVSPGYRHEILTPEFGCGLETYLRSRADSITGILNGLDLAAWDPETDQNLPANYNIKDISQRAVNKAALQNELGLPEESRVPIMAMIGRIDPQKGVDITIDALKRLSEHAWQFVILGSGNPDLENAARALQEVYPDRVRAVIQYNARLSRLIYAGADMFLMPSRYEPCGLAQMIAMRYGSVPIVHSTGGLKDTVHEGKTGFLFEAADGNSLQAAIKRAFSVYERPNLWEQFQKNGMQENFSWMSSAAQYAVLYRSLTSN
jgi:starch synthase